MNRLRPWLLGALILLAPGAAGAAAPDWTVVGDVEVVEVLTHDEDGDLRETKIWFVLIDEECFLRTRDSRWLSNIRRDPNDIVLRIEDEEYPMTGEVLEDERWISRVDEATVEKYGWQEKFIHIFRMSPPDILVVRPVVR